MLNNNLTVKLLLSWKLKFLSKCIPLACQQSYYSDRQFLLFLTATLQTSISTKLSPWYLVHGPWALFRTTRSKLISKRLFPKLILSGIEVSAFSSSTHSANSWISEVGKFLQRSWSREITMICWFPHSLLIRCHCHLSQCTMGHIKR